MRYKFSLTHRPSTINPCVNWSNTLTQGLKFLTIGNSPNLIDGLGPVNDTSVLSSINTLSRKYVKASNQATVFPTSLPNVMSTTTGTSVVMFAEFSVPSVASITSSTETILSLKTNTNIASGTAYIRLGILSNLGAVVVSFDCWDGGNYYTIQSDDIGMKDNKPIKLAVYINKAISTTPIMYINGVLTSNIFQSGTIVNRAPLPYASLGNAIGSGDAASANISLAGIIFDSNAIPSTAQRVSANPWQLFQPISRPIFVPASYNLQKLRPIADIDKGPFVPNYGALVYDTLDETIPYAGDASVADTVGSTTVKLDTGTDPVSSAGHVLRYQLQGSGNTKVELIEQTNASFNYILPKITVQAQQPQNIKSIRPGWRIVGTPTEGPIVIDGNMTKEPRGSYMCWIGNGSTKMVYNSLTRPVVLDSVTGGCTLVTVFSGSSTLGTLVSLGSSGNTVGGYVQIVRQASGQLNIAFDSQANADGFSVSSSGKPSVNDAKFHTAVAIFRTVNGTEHYAILYCDGIMYVGAWSVGWNASSYDRMAINGLRRSSSSDQNSDAVALGAVGPVISDSEAIELSRNPWQLFQANTKLPFNLPRYNTIATYQHSASIEPEIYTQTLTPTEADSISDYSKLSVRVSAL